MTLVVKSQKVLEFLKVKLVERKIYLEKLESLKDTLDIMSFSYRVY